MKNQTFLSDVFIPSLDGDYSQLILENLDESIVLVNTDLVILQSNRAAREGIWKETGMTLTPGKPVLDSVDEDRVSLLKDLFVEVLAGHKRKTEYTYTCPDGTLTYFENEMLPARSREGKVIGIIIYSRDITTRKKAELAIKEAEERWQFAFEASSQAAWDWNMQTNEVIYSSSYKKTYGFTEDELKNNVEEWQCRIHPDDQEKMEEHLKKHIESTNPVYETTYRIRLKDGRYKWILARGKIVSKDENGKPLRMIGTHTDLTETMETKEKIRKMNERFAYAAKASSQALWEWDGQTDEIYISPVFTELFGWQVDAVRRFDQWFQFLHPDERERVREKFTRTAAMPGNVIWEDVYRFRKADGSYAIISNKAYILKDEKNRTLKIIGASQDITAQRLIEEELYKSNERYDIMLQATNELLWEWDMTSLEVYRSTSGLKKVYGLDNDTLVKTHKQWLDRIHPDDRSKVIQELQKVAHGTNKQTFEMEYRFLNGNGTYNHIYGRGMVLTDEEGKPVRMIGTEQNISERKQLEQELLKNELEYKKLINQATVDSQEQERSEIGRELHDNVNQVLTTTKLYLELALSNKQMTHELVRKSSSNISNVINEIRQLSRSLMDPTIGDLGIVDSMNDLVENINLLGKLHVDLQADPAIEENLDRSQKLTMFRIIQESLNNILRHANAKNVAICIQQLDDQIKLSISDDGVGFLQESVKKGAGLKNITNRIYLINGSFEIISSPGNGCQILISFPVNNSN